MDICMYVRMCNVRMHMLAVYNIAYVHTYVCTYVLYCTHVRMYVYFIGISSCALLSLTIDSTFEYYMYVHTIL